MSFSHFKALIKKNLLIAKRKFIMTLIELLLPIIVMILFWRLYSLFEIKNLPIDDDNNYIESNGTYLRKEKAYGYDLKYVKFVPLAYCSYGSIVVLIGKDFPEDLLNLIKGKGYYFIYYTDMIYKYYDSLESLNEYIRSENYNDEDLNPEVCFGLSYIKENNKYTIKLHYFASPYSSKKPSIPTTTIDNLDPFQVQPDFESYGKYIEQGFLMMLKTIYDYILRKETGQSDAEIKLRVNAQKYDKFLYSSFYNFLSMLFGFFMLIGYAFPLTINIFKLVKEKESKAKEGMKIMGLNELLYFFSYFLIYFIINIIYSIFNAFIIKKVLTYIEEIYLFFFLLLFGLVIFSLVYFFQSFLEKTRIAIIISLLIYCIMFFLALPVYSNSVSRVIKIIFCLLFPPITMQLGINTICQFQIKINEFNGRVFMRYNKFSFFDMYILFICNFILYMFLGFYLQNILSHDYGIKKPWYFLCTKNFWGCQNSNKKNENNINESNINISRLVKRKNIKSRNKNYANFTLCTKSNLNDETLKEEQIIEDNKDITKQNDYFEDEKKYEDFNHKTEVFQIKNIHKTFDDGKVALKGVSFNLYKNEIFALLGHNGAGKSTLINILIGLYTSTSGSAIYNSYDILTPEGSQKFRKILGICPQHDVLFNDLTVEEHLELFCVFKSVDSSLISKEVTKVINEFGLEEKRYTKAENLSGGQKRKLSIAIAVVGGSSVIFLDEPTSGMDITSRRNLWNILKKSLNGKIIILTTHYMEEASILGNRIGILSEGDMKCIGSPLFLIENFGKTLNLNITKSPEADDEEIINYVNQYINQDINTETEILNEEILFRIPKDDYLLNMLKNNSFFSKLDNQCKKLNIKNYSISMSTLEDVFINLSKIIKHKNQNNEKLNKEENEQQKRKDTNDNLLYDENNYNANYNNCTKILRDIKVSFKKRIFQIYRDKKTFISEILCPILLTLIGCVVGSIEFLEINRTLPLYLNQLTNDTQTIFYSYTDNLKETFSSFDNKFFAEDISNIKFKKIEIEDNNFSTNGILYMNQLYNIKKEINEKSYAYYIISELDKVNHKYEFFCFLDIVPRQSAPIYVNFILNNMLRFITDNPNLEIEIINEPLTYTKKEIKDKQSRNDSMILFFISLSFALIPANFITILIKERENNSKHLQIISGISLFSYWFNNYLFELIKYYVIGGICILILFIFDFYQDYLYILYLEYGPAMISFTYLFSFIFKSEEKGQISVLLIYLIFGVLGGNAIIILRLYKDLIKYAEPIIYILRILPSFCFCYGFNQLMRRNELFIVDNLDEDEKLLPDLNFNDEDILDLKYMGYDCVYLAVESVVYLLILIFLENSLVIFKCCFTSKTNNKNIKIELKEKRNNLINTVNIYNKNDLNNPVVNKESTQNNEVISTAKEQINNKNEEENNNYFIKIQNLVKTYYGGPFGFKIFERCFKSTKAVRDISLYLEQGEVFGLLGINGAGKTTTFKCLSNEIFPTSGNIYINDIDILSNFNKVRNLIGYCPQDDPIFEYLTVYQNLEFYGIIKGAEIDKIKYIIDDLVEEMNLKPFKDVISGTLSGGNKRKLSVAIALICSPPIILLDEPSTGMDPEARKYMWEVINRVSLNQKKSTIIMTTHSMEEAETLCKKIGILVDGEFKCLGTKDEIKEQFGFGYEINLQINTPDANYLYNIYKVNDEHREQCIYLNTLEESLKLYGLENYKHLINKDSFGKNIFEELENQGYISFDIVFLWVYYLKNVLGMINTIKNYFDEIYCVDCRENNFIFKIKRNKIEGEKSIGFLFELIEENKSKYDISQYSIELSSLEQIFNKFAQEKEKNETDNYAKNDILISKELINSLL